MRLLKSNAGTAYGETYCFSEIKSPKEYQDRVPLTEYDDYLPYIERITAGEGGVLTSSAVRVLEYSSGSTAPAKLIPYTKQLQKEFRRASAAWIFDIYRNNPALAGGRAYWSITPIARKETPSTSKIPIGFEEDSEYLGSAAKQLINMTMAAPSKVGHVKDMENFRYISLLFLLGSGDLSLISVWHPSFLTLLLEPLSAHWENLLLDLATGKINPPRPIASSIKRDLEKNLRPQGKRARELKRLGYKNLHSIWPALGLVSCWGDGHAGLCLEELRRILPKAQIQPKGLIATEAFATIPFGGRNVLALRSHFFEFESESGKLFLAHELSKGETYSLIVTTGGGLYRYRLKDLVEVVGYADAAPTLRFVGKEEDVSDFCGEKLSSGFVASVLKDILSELEIRFSMLAMDGNSRSYVLFVDAREEIPNDLGLRLEEELKQNPHYRYCVDLGQLNPARVFLVKGNAYGFYSEECRRQGMRLGDIKPTPLSRTTDWTEIFQGEFHSSAIHFKKTAVQ